MSREAICQAVFAIAAKVNWGTVPAPLGFVTMSRRLSLFSDIAPGQQPYLGQVEHGEQISQPTETPYISTMEIDWFIYHRAGDAPGSTPTSFNNQILDAIFAAFAPPTNDPGFFDNRNTLSGLVRHCFISGKVIRDPGDIDKQGLLIVPIKVLVP